MCVHFPQHTSSSLCFAFLHASHFFQVELEIFVGAKSNDGRDWMKESSPVLEHATLLTLQCSLSGLCQAVRLSCVWLPAAGKLCWERPRSFLDFEPVFWVLEDFQGVCELFQSLSHLACHTYMQHLSKSPLSALLLDQRNATPTP